MRTGKQYLKSLNDGRTVILDGEVVGNVLEHPAFANVARTMAELFDIAADPANGMQFHSDEINGPANRTFAAPRTQEELVLRRQAIEKWAKHTHGWVGRSPDHVGTFFAAFGSHPDVFKNDERDFAGNVERYYKKILSENLYLSYAIIPPRRFPAQPRRPVGKANTCRSASCVKPRRASLSAVRRCSPQAPPLPTKSLSPASSPWPGRC